MTYTTNVALGTNGKKLKKMSVPWLVNLHASIPLVVTARMGLGLPRAMIPINVLIAVAGQITGRSW